MIVSCAKCGDTFEVPDELIGDQPLDESQVFCGQCNPDEYPGIAFDDRYDEDGEPDFTLDELEWQERYPELVDVDLEE